MSEINLPVADRASLSFADDIPTPVRVQVHALLAKWSPRRLHGRVEISRLTGGASNINLRLAATDEAFALRLCMPDSARWGVDRAAAIQAQRDAARLNLAPAVIDHVLPDGHYLSEFVEGTVVTGENLREHNLIGGIARTLRQLHSGTTTARDFSPFDDMRTFLELGAAEITAEPEGLDDMLALTQRIEALFRNRPAPRAFCHSDLVPQNFIRTGPGEFKMVDFDYAGNGWVAFEMASFCCQAQLDATETDIFLTSYDPDIDDGERARVELMRLVAGVREAAWAVMAEPILGAHTSPLDGWTYSGYAEANIAQARGVVDHGFGQLMRAARTVRPGARF